MVFQLKMLNTVLEIDYWARSLSSFKFVTNSCMPNHIKVFLCSKVWRKYLFLDLTLHLALPKLVKNEINKLQMALLFPVLTRHNFRKALSYYRIIFSCSLASGVFSTFSLNYTDASDFSDAI